MTDDKPSLCTLYVFHNDERRLLYVCDAAEFPVRQFNESDWRKVACGVEPPPSGQVSLQRFAYYPARLPKKSLH